MVIETRSPEETFAVGKSLGEKAFPGQVLTLTGDLGVGKTVFTQGLAEGLGIEEPVNSPTFTIVQVYEEGRLPFYHFDVYRIGDIEEMDEVGFEEYVMGEGVSLIEWANLIEEILPERRTNILIEKDLTKSGGSTGQTLETLCSVRSDLVAVYIYDEQGKLVDSHTGTHTLKEHYLKDLSYIELDSYSPGVLYLSEPRSRRTEAAGSH